MAIVAEVTTPRELPSPEELDLANYLIGTYLSEISNFAERLEWIKGDPMTVEEYLERDDRRAVAGSRRRRRSPSPPRVQWRAALCRRFRGPGLDSATSATWGGEL
jgi:hypothetical protein